MQYLYLIPQVSHFLSEDINDYIIEYEYLYKRMTDFDMKLPDPVLTFKLLDGANLTDDDRKLALANVENVGIR